MTNSSITDVVVFLWSIVDNTRSDRTCKYYAVVVDIIISLYLVLLHSACSEHQFQCRSGQCIPATYRCDGTTHCPDNSDEDDPQHCGKIIIPCLSATRGEGDIVDDNVFDEFCNIFWAMHNIINKQAAMVLIMTGIVNKELSTKPNFTTKSSDVPFHCFQSHVYSVFFPICIIGTSIWKS